MQSDRTYRCSRMSPFRYGLPSSAATREPRSIGVTTIYGTHDQAEALELSDLVAVINQGRIVQMGDPREIYFRPHDPFVAGFVGATNLMQGTSRTNVAS